MKQVIDNLDSISPLIVLLYVLSFRKLRGDNIFVFYYVLMQFLLNLFSSIKSFINPTYNNIWIYQLNALLSLIILTIFFQKTNPYAKNVYAKAMNLLFIILVCSIICYEKQDAFNSISYSSVSIIITFFCLYYYWYLMKETPTQSLRQNPIFFFVTGLLIYYSTNILTFATYHTLTIDNVATNSIAILWKFHNFMLTVLCIFLLKGFACITSSKTPPS